MAERQEKGRQRERERREERARGWKHNVSHAGCEDGQMVEMRVLKLKDNKRI